MFSIGCRASDHGEHDELQHGVVGCVGDSSMKAHIRCAEVLVRDRSLLLHFDLSGHGVEFRLLGSGPRLADAQQLQFLARFQDLRDLEFTQAHQERGGGSQVGADLLTARPVDEGTACRATPRSDQALRCPPLQRLAYGSRDTWNWRATVRACGACSLPTRTSWTGRPPA